MFRVFINNIKAYWNQIHYYSTIKYLVVSGFDIERPIETYDGSIYTIYLVGPKVELQYDLIGRWGKLTLKEPNQITSRSFKDTKGLKSIIKKFKYNDN